MNDFDNADLDGDGEFDCIDIEILEESNSLEDSKSSKTGCCVPLLLAGASISGATIILARFLA